MISKKICLIGDFGVGKTSLIRRFVDRQFSDQYLSTVGVKISRKTLDIFPTEPDKKLSVQLLIWDVEGSNRFKAIAPTYLQGAKGAVVVADVSRMETVEGLAEHVQGFLNINPQGFLIIALNKSDLADEEKQAKLMQMVRFSHTDRVAAVYPTSARIGTSVDLIFQTLTYKIVEKE